MRAVYVAKGSRPQQPQPKTKPTKPSEEQGFETAVDDEPVGLEDEDIDLDDDITSDDLDDEDEE